jgi:hypothetical protein
MMDEDDVAAAAAEDAAFAEEEARANEAGGGGDGGDGDGDGDGKEKTDEKKTAAVPVPVMPVIKVYPRATEGGPDFSVALAAATREYSSHKLSTACHTIGMALKAFMGVTLPESARALALLRADVLHGLMWYEKEATYCAMLTQLWPDRHETWAARGRAGLARGELHHHTRSLACYREVRFLCWCLCVDCAAADPRWSCFFFFRG